MGNPKQKWTAAEEEALKKGVAKHGTGKWKVILRDPEFSLILFSRSNIDLKDKWRNMGVTAGGQRPREKSQTPKAKNNSEDPPLEPASNTPTSAVVINDATPDELVNDSSNKGEAYTMMIFEALSALKDQNGSMPAAIFDYIKQRYDVPPNFRKLLTSRLRKLAAKEKVEKIQNSYKLKTDDMFVTTPTGRQEDIKPKQLQGSCMSAGDMVDGGTGAAACKIAAAENVSPVAAKAVKEEDEAMKMAEDIDSSLQSIGEVEPKQLQSIGYEPTADMVDKAAFAAASRIAEAENKSFVAAEAVKEAERVTKMAEDTESLLQLANEIFYKCSRGEIVRLA